MHNMTCHSISINAFSQDALVCTYVHTFAYEHLALIAPFGHFVRSRLCLMIPLN